MLANTEAAANWDGDSGAHWATHWRRYDRGLAGYHARLLDAAAIGAGDRVLDVGCGNGQLTRDVARAAYPGAVLGLDLSSAMLARARELAAVEDVSNVRFDQADAQVHPLDPGSFDVVVSRMGVMFFADPVAAFANIGSGLRPGGRLVMTVWQSEQRNEWQRAIRDAIRTVVDVPAFSPAGQLGASGLSDPDLTRGVLTSAGFVGVHIESLELPMWSGTDAVEATEYYMNGPAVRRLAPGLDGQGRARLRDAMLQMLLKHETSDGVIFGSSGWLIRAGISAPDG